MTLPTLFTRAALAATLALAGTTAHAAPDYAPYDGRTGYHEILLAPDTWYVAAFGDADLSIDVLERWWLRRVAELCRAAGAAYAAELRYPGEPLTAQDRTVNRGGAASAYLRHTAATFIPIYLPSQPPRDVITPAKQAAMRCVKNPAELLDPKRAQALAP